MASSTIKVDGSTYSSPAEAYTAAELIEHDAQERADAYRRSGDEGMADTTIDRGNAKAERLRAWARQREADEAAATAQPAGRPKARASSKRSRPGARAGRGGRTGSRPPRAFGGSSGRAFRHGYRRSGAQAAVTRATGFGWQLAGLTVAMALLALFLRPRGVSAFTELANFAAGALAIVVDPVDPLEPKLLDKIAAQAKPKAPAKPLSPLSPAGLYGTSLVKARPPANRRAPRTAVV